MSWHLLSQWLEMIIRLQAEISLAVLIQSRKAHWCSLNVCTVIYFLSNWRYDDGSLKCFGFFLILACFRDWHAHKTVFIVHIVGRWNQTDETKLIWQIICTISLCANAKGNFHLRCFSSANWCFFLSIFLCHHSAGISFFFNEKIQIVVRWFFLCLLITLNWLPLSLVSG